jgi:alanine dehydrogenase
LSGDRHHAQLATGREAISIGRQSTAGFPAPPPLRLGERAWVKLRGMIPVLGNEAVLAAVDPATAIERTRLAFERHAHGEWVMPAKVYLDSPPGDFRAMPARGDGLAMLKWVTSFPDNPERGLPVVTGVLLLSDADTGEELAVMDCRAVTWLRTGAAAAVSAQALAAASARSIGVIGCGANGAWAARCLAEAGYGPGICADKRPEAANALAEELGWGAGDRAEAAAQDIVVTMTSGRQPVIFGSDLRPGQHLVVMGADAHEKSEVEAEALRRCRLFCDEWEQASTGGELSAAVEAGLISPEDVSQLGEVLTGAAEGRRSVEEITLFDSTGLAIQDLGIAAAVYGAWQEGRLEAPTVAL